MKNKIYTIGHSNHQLEKFISLLKKHEVTVLGDVRSSPYSRFHQQYNREAISKSLADVGIKYVFLGKELGARSEDRSCYQGGRVHYNLLASTDLFKSGLERIRMGVERGYKIALMCAEKEPLECHRTVLVARNLDKEGFNISHILSNGTLETQGEVTARLVAQFNLNQTDLFADNQGRDMTEEAFLMQEEKIAYAEEGYTERKVAQ